MIPLKVDEIRTDLCHSNVDFVTPAGSPYSDEFGFVKDDDGVDVVGVVGQHDQQAYIQSFEQSSKLENIVKSMVPGEENKYWMLSGSTFDCSYMPKSLQDAYHQIHQAEIAFSRLSPDERGKFNNNFQLFLKSVSDGSIFKMQEKVAPAKIDTVDKEEVIENA